MQNYPSRSERQTKRRKNERILYILISIAVLFFILLLIFIFTDKDEDTKEPIEEETNIEVESEEEDLEPETTRIVTSEDESDDIVIQEIESSDENVMEAFVGNWEPIGTEQEEPHTTNFDDGSTDRKEIKEAVLSVTQIEADQLIEHWIGNGGEQKVIATVEDWSNNEYYRVYLSWIKNEGWQVTLVEKIKELDNP